MGARSIQGGFEDKQDRLISSPRLTFEKILSALRKANASTGKIPLSEMRVEIGNSLKISLQDFLIRVEDVGQQEEDYTHGRLAFNILATFPEMINTPEFQQRYKVSPEEQQTLLEGFHLYTLWQAPASNQYFEALRHARKVSQAEFLAANPTLSISLDKFLLKYEPLLINNPHLPRLEQKRAHISEIEGRYTTVPDEPHWHTLTFHKAAMKAARHKELERLTSALKPAAHEATDALEKLGHEYRQAYLKSQNVRS